MNKTRLLEKISIQSGVSLDECGTVLKTFEKVLSEELSRKIYRYGGWILLLTALFVSVTVFSQTTGRKGRPVQTIHKSKLLIVRSMLTYQSQTQY